MGLSHLNCGTGRSEANADGDAAAPDSPPPLAAVFGLCSIACIDPLCALTAMTRVVCVWKLSFSSIETHSNGNNYAAVEQFKERQRQRERERVTEREREIQQIPIKKTKTMIECAYFRFQCSH